MVGYPGPPTHPTQSTEACPWLGKGPGKAAKDGGGEGGQEMGFCVPVPQWSNFLPAQNEIKQIPWTQSNLLP